MIQLYAGDVLAYDSRVHELRLLKLTMTEALNKGGTLTLTLPPDHPCRGAFTPYGTHVTVYEDGRLRFRGRVLQPSEDFYKRLTVTCEGERCFLRDSVQRSYLYTDTPQAIFTSVIGGHNAQVGTSKGFAVGTVTVTDANDYVRLESTQTETTLAVVDKLVERCGGYITFTTNADGIRTINWLADLGQRSEQAIEFGANLTDHTITQQNEDFATVLIPYGAKLDDSEKRLNIAAVNNGIDQIQDDEAVALFGKIFAVVEWDDVTEAANLLTKAKQELNRRKSLITSLKVTAVDLSRIDPTVAAFRVGDLVRAKSKPHNLDDDFLLTDRTEDLLTASVVSITLGKEQVSMTGQTVAGDKANQSALQRVETNITADYTLGIAAAIEEAKATLSSLIQQTAQEIRLEVSEQYATNERLTSYVSTELSQKADSFNFNFNQLQATIDANDAEAQARYEELQRYIRFIDGVIHIGEEGNPVSMQIAHDLLGIYDSGAEATILSNKLLSVLYGYFLHSLRIGPGIFLPRENGHVTLTKARD